MARLLARLFSRSCKMVSSFWGSTGSGSKRFLELPSWLPCFSTVGWRDGLSARNASPVGTGKDPGGSSEDRRQVVGVVTRISGAVGGVPVPRLDRDLYLRLAGFSIFPDFLEHFHCPGRHGASRHGCFTDDLDHCDRRD